MPLTLKRGRDGSFRKHWYGVIQINGKRIVENLNVRVRGTPPESLRDEGNAAFEKSRAEAQEKLEELKKKHATKGRADHLLERLIESKTGKTVEYVRLADLPMRWRSIPRTSRVKEEWLRSCDAMFRNFSKEMDVEFLYEVTPEMVANYLNKLRSVTTTKTTSNVVSLFRSAFKRLLPPGAHNPFTEGISRKNESDDGDTIHRRPFTAQEITVLFEAARLDSFLFPLVVTAACTGMRRGDVCRLRWSSVNLAYNVIAVKTSKTGASVEIPIFAPLRQVLLTAESHRKEEDVYVWPDAALMADESPDTLTWRFKKLLAAILPDPQDSRSNESGAHAVCPVKLGPVLDKVCEAVRLNLTGKMLDRTLDSLQRYAEGASIRDIEAVTGQARSGIAGDLHRAENLSKIYFMPDATRIGAKNKIARLTRKDRGRGCRAASVLDWHALRVTWVTLALSSGVPMEVVKLVTGHKTVEVVLKHYFKPGREQLRALLSDKLPEVLTGGKDLPKRLPTGGMMAEDSAVGEGWKVAQCGDAVKELAAKVAAGNATYEERQRLCKLLAVPARDGCASS